LGCGFDEEETLKRVRALLNRTPFIKPQMSGLGLSPALFITLLRDVQITRYCRLASSVIIYYDHLITLDREMDLIWKKKWSLSKVIFLLNRYYILAAAVFGLYSLLSPALNDTFCARFYQWQGYTGLIGFMLAQALLQMQIYALYSMNKKILAFMLTFYLSLSAVSAWILQGELALSAAIAISLPGGEFCIVSNISPKFYTFWLPVLLCDSLLCALAIIGGLRGSKSASSFFRRGFSLVKALILGSVFYYLVIAVSYLTCLLLWKFASPGLLDAPIGFATAMACISSNRVLFNLHEAGKSRLPVFILSEV